MNNIFDDLDKYFEEQEKRFEQWKEKYAWDINDIKFKNKLNEIIAKVLDNGIYSVSENENEDFEYLDSFDCFLLESQLNKYSTDFYQDEDRTLAISTTPFSYNNNVYILEHSCEKETSFSIYKSDKKILQHQIVKVEFNC